MNLIIFIVLFYIIPYKLCQDKFSFESSVSQSKFANPDDFGYRYCAYWKLADGTTIYSSCDPFSFQRCGKTLEIAYDCCHGFKKLDSSIFDPNPSSHQVCAQTIPQWKYCSDVLSLFDQVSYFAKFLKSDQMLNENSDKDFTIFAPEIKNSNDIFANQGSNRPMFYHVVKGRFHVNNLRNNQELESYYENQKLKVTKYSFGVICIDCVEITKADLECKNGVIHFIRKSLVPSSGTSFKRLNLIDALKSDPEVSSFANDIPIDIQNEMKNIRSGAWYTILPVKNDNWNEIKNKVDSETLRIIIRNHIVFKLYCSAALYKNIKKLRTLSGEINVECSTKDNSEIRFISNALGSRSQLISLDNMARNGVYHVVDKALVPLEARTIKSILTDAKLASDMKTTVYFNYIKDCDLKMEPGKKYSIFFPKDISFKWWESYNQFQPEFQRFKTDKEYRCRVARYHIVPYNPEFSSTGLLWHEQKGYKTNNLDVLHQVDYFSKDKDKTELYFHFSPVAEFSSNQFRDGSFYRLSKINVIPEKFIVDILKENSKLTITSNQVQKTKMNLTEFHSRRPLSLFLATLDDGLKDLKTGKNIEWITELDGKSLNNYLLLHTVPLYLWGGDIGYFKKNTIHKFMSRSGIELIFWMDNSGTMRIGYENLPKEQWAEVVRFNLHAKDGIIWLLKRNIPCPQNLCPHKVEIIDNDLFDVFVSACQFMELPGITSVRDARNQFRKFPIQIAMNNTDKCAVFKQPTYKVSKKIDI